MCSGPRNVNMTNHTEIVHTFYYLFAIRTNFNLITSFNFNSVATTLTPPFYYSDSPFLLWLYTDPLSILVNGRSAFGKWTPLVGSIFLNRIRPRPGTAPGGPSSPISCQSSICHTKRTLQLEILNRFGKSCYRPR